MELISYLTLIAAAFIAIFINRKMPLLIYWFLFIGFLLIVRLSGFDTDVAKYAKWMVWDFKGFVYYREFLYFFVSRTLYGFFNSEIYAFWAMDVLWCVVVLYALKKIFDDNKDAYVCFAILSLSFPVMMGFENFYRQHMATAFALLAYSFSSSGVVRSGFLSLASILFHNSAVLTTPTILGKKLLGFSAGVRALVIVLLVMFLFFVLLLFSSGGAGDFKKSNASTGLNLSMLYVALFFCILIFSLFITRGSFKDSFEEFTPAYVGFFLVILMASLFNDAPAERVGQLFIVLSVPSILVGIRRVFKAGYGFFAACFMLFLAVPMLIFDNALQFLL
ncbi:MAG: EpsG family protein [Gammaproteobacteria bacterium]|nr:EpsG family protein [Gammaproteobacteria bacterium]